MAVGKKTGGRKPGTVNQSTSETRDWAARLKQAHGVDAVIKDVMENGELRDKLVVWKLLTEYERGKPVQPIAGGDGGPVQINIVTSVQLPKRPSVN